MLCVFQPAVEQLGETESSVEGELLKKKAHSYSRTRSREVNVKGRISGSGSLLSLKKESVSYFAMFELANIRKALNSVIDISLFGFGGWLAY